MTQWNRLFVGGVFAMAALIAVPMGVSVRAQDRQPIHVSNVDDLYAAVNDPDHAGARIVIAPGTYAEHEIDEVPGGVPIARDFDGDGRTDLAVYRPSNGTWYVLQSSTNYTTYSAHTWGLGGDMPVPGDYDGDGTTDFAVYRPSTGAWYILQSSTNYTTYFSYLWGLGGDVPVPADYDGDRKADIAVYRPSDGGWYILQSSTNYATYASYVWGLAGDMPIPADFDGDGKTDLVVWRPSTGTWFILYSSLGYSVPNAGVFQWGLPGDVPIAGDFDGDGKTDLAVWRPSTGTWFILYSSLGYSVPNAGVFQWGLPGDVPISTDFDGDGKTELTVFRPSNGTWSTAPGTTLPPPPTNSLVTFSVMCNGDSEHPFFDCSVVDSDADGGYTLNPATLYTFWFGFTGSAPGRCRAWTVTYSWGGGSTEPCRGGDIYAVGLNVFTPADDGSLDLQHQRITFVVEERAPDVPDFRMQALEFPIRVVR